MSENGSTYCKARPKLSVQLINILRQRVVEIQKTKALNQWKWNSRNIDLVDGLTLRAADTKANHEVYPQPSTLKECGAPFGSFGYWFLPPFLSSSLYRAT